MLNNLVLVGRVCNDLKLITTDNGYKVTNITLAVQRPFKSQDDVYETDFFDVKVTFATAEISADYLTKGSIIGIKGRIATKQIVVEGKKMNVVEVIGERVSFIHLHKKNDQVIDELVDQVDE